MNMPTIEIFFMTPVNSRSQCASTFDYMDQMGLLAIESLHKDLSATIVRSSHELSGVYQHEVYKGSTSHLAAKRAS